MQIRCGIMLTVVIQPQKIERHFHLVTALMVMVLLTGCQQTTTGNVLDAQREFQQPAIAELPTSPTYRIGINTEVTGTGAQIGDLSIRAARLAIEEINTTGGVNGVPLELIVRDARSDPFTALAQYKKAVVEDNLDALLGPFKSAYGVLIIPAHRANTLPMFIGATNATLTQQGVDHLFRMRPSDSLSAPAMVALALDHLDARHIGLIYDIDAFGSGGADIVEAELENQSLEPAVRLGYQTGKTEFDSLVQQLAEADVDTVLIYGTNQTDLGYLLRAIRYWDKDVPIITSPSGSSIVTHNIAAEAQDGIYVVLDALLDLSPEGRHLQQAFDDRFSLQPDTYIAWYYDAVHLLAHIWREHPQAAGSELSRLIRVSNFQGAQGRYCFNRDGEGLHIVLLAQMHQGKPQLLGVYSDAGIDISSPSIDPTRCPQESKP